MRLINEIIVHRTDAAGEMNHHYVVREDGRVVQPRSISLPSGLCDRHKAHSISVAYRGTEGDSRTAQQGAALVKLIYQLIQMYRSPVHSASEYGIPGSPGFDAKAEFGQMYKRIVFS